MSALELAVQKALPTIKAMKVRHTALHDESHKGGRSTHTHSHLPFCASLPLVSRMSTSR